MAQELRRARRHPAEVTSDRLSDHCEHWFDHLTADERDAISRVRNALERIAEGREPETQADCRCAENVAYGTCGH